MEDDLDQISVGEIEPNPWLDDFYFGSVDATGKPLPGLRDLVSDERLADIDPVEINTIPIGVDSDGQVVVAKVGKTFHTCNEATNIDHYPPASPLMRSLST